MPIRPFPGSAGAATPCHDLTGHALRATAQTLTDLARQPVGEPVPVLIVAPGKRGQQRLIASSGVPALITTPQGAATLGPLLGAVALTAGSQHTQHWYALAPPSPPLLPRPDYLPLLLALVNAPTLCVAAERCFLSRKTLYRRLEALQPVLPPTPRRTPPVWARDIFTWLVGGCR